ncbi:MAG: DUF1554 domain-containing protein [Deltaproteobacteria bacterium]|nr:DUF1554 domain-containing protein [Deltaproteobacteria bacterium]
MHRATVAMTMVALSLLIAGAAQAAVTAAQKCQAGKNQQAGKYAFCRQQAHKKLVLTGNTEAYDAAILKCEGTFELVWQKLIDAAERAGAICPDDPLTKDDFKTVIDGHAGNVATGLAGDGLQNCPADLSTCEADLVVAEACGNVTLDVGEDCELGTLEGATCGSLGLGGGTLACGAGCVFDTRRCGDYKRIFVSSAGLSGNLGELAGADAECQARADAAFLGGTWTAWLSTGTVNAPDRVPDAEYRLVDQIAVIANSRADLIDQTIDHVINIDENGDAHSGWWVWTGTFGDGTPTLNRCSDWTSNSSGFEGALGSTDFTTNSWTAGSQQDCDLATAHLYCFEQ